jgi:hypothetical protein
MVQRCARGATAFYDIDTPVTLAKLARGDHEYLAPELIPGFDAYLSFTGGPTLERLMRVHGAPAAHVLYCCVDPERYPALGLPHRWDLSYLGTYSPDRQPVLERLLLEPARRAPELRFVVAGPQYPADITWPANVERFEHVSPADHPAFYASSRFTLNVTRADMVRAGWSPSVRLFEAASCGAPVISDIWDGIEDVLRPGREIVLATGPEEVLGTLTTMSEARRRAIAGAARERVLSAHTAAHRAAELEAHLPRRHARRAAAAAAHGQPGKLQRKGSARDERKEQDRARRGRRGLLGSHLCDLLLAEGRHVICLDSFLTGRRRNLRHLERDPALRPNRARHLGTPAGAAAGAGAADGRRPQPGLPASPPHYQADPEHTMMTCVLGTRHLLRLAEAKGARCSWPPPARSTATRRCIRSARLLGAT